MHLSAMVNRSVKGAGLRFATKEKSVTRNGKMWVLLRQTTWNTFLGGNAPDLTGMGTRDWTFLPPFAITWVSVTSIFAIGASWISRRFREDHGRSMVITTRFCAIVRRALLS